MARIRNEELASILRQAASMMYGSDTARFLSDEAETMQVSDETKEKISRAVGGKDVMINRKKILRILKIAAIAAVAATMVACVAAEPLREVIAGMLTDIFKKEDTLFSEEYEVFESIEPIYNPETREITCVCSKLTDEGTVYSYVTTLPDGTFVREEKITVIEDDFSTFIGTRSGDKVIFLLYDMDERMYFLRTVEIGEEANTVTDSEPVEELADMPVVSDMVMDGNGTIVISCSTDFSGNIVFGLDGQGEVLYQFTANSYNLNVYGGVVLCGTTMITDGAPGEELDMPDGITVRDYHFTEDGSMYIETGNGLYLYTEEGEPERIMSFENSNLINNMGLRLFKVLDRENLLFLENGEVTLYTIAPDVDLAETVVLDFAYVKRSGAPESRVVEFNKSNPGIRVVSKEYESADALLTDIYSGVYRPDVVMGSDFEPAFAARIMSEGLYTDLYPLIDASENLTRDDLSGAVKRTYEMEDGTLAAITSTFTVETLLGTKEYIGERTSWTVSDMLELAKTLPEGVTLIDGLTSNNASAVLFGSDAFGITPNYAPFVDMKNLTASFDSEDFIDYLAFLKALPGESLGYRTREDLWQMYADGTLALAKYMYADVAEYLREDLVFAGKEYVNIGYPSGGSSAGGARISACPYMITSFCDNTAEAWLFLEQVLFFDEQIGEDIRFRSAFPAYKPLFETMCEDFYEYYYKFLPNGRYVTSIARNGEVSAEIDGEPAEVRRLTPEIAAEITAWLDNEVGSRVTGTVPADLSAIVDEEISACLAGNTTAEECAERVQSRVNIWLSERE